MSEYATLSLAARPPFAALLPQASAADAGVVVAARPELRLATVLARNGAVAALRQRLSERYHVDAPAGPAVVAVPGFALIGTGPGAWLAVGDAAGDVAERLTQDLKGLASVSDQSDGYAVITLAGPRVRDAMAKGFTLDLHPQAFAAGAAAVTAAAHIGVIVWRLPNDPAHAPTFHVAVTASYAGSFWHWLAESAAEFGLGR